MTDLDENENGPEISHINGQGNVHMVDVGAKPATRRIAVAEASVLLGEKAHGMLVAACAPKGDILAAARIAGIQAAKRTSSLIPLCHAVPLTHVSVEVQPTATGVSIRCRAETVAATGVEMEALTGASMAALTIYDMLKAVERGIRIEAVQLLEKRGGRSGVWHRRTNETLIER